MKITIKKVLSLVLSVMLAFVCVSAAFAADGLANYAGYDNAVSTFANLKLNSGYQRLCIPEYVDYIDEVLAEVELPRDLDASEQALIDEAIAKIDEARAVLLTDKYLKAQRADIDSAFAEIDELFAALGELTEEQQAEADALKAKVEAMKADKDNVSKEELDEIITTLRELENYVDNSKAADYSKYDYEVATFEMLKTNTGYQRLCIPSYSEYIDEVLTEVELPRDLLVTQQYLINEAIDKIAAARALLVSNEYLKAPVSEIDDAFAQIDAFIAGLEDLTAEEQAEVDALKAKVEAMKADKDSVSRQDLADILTALENLQTKLDDTAPADYTQYDIEVDNFANLKYNTGYQKACVPEYVDYIDAVLAEVALPRDLLAKEQYLIDEAVAKIQAARANLLSDEYMKASESDVDDLIAEIEEVLDSLGDIADEVKEEVDALREKLEEIKADKDSVSKQELADVLEALEELKKLIEELENSEPADYTDYNYYYPQITARAQHPFYYTIFIPSYGEIVEAFIADVTIPKDLPASKQYIVDEAVEKLLDFDMKLKYEYFREEPVEEDVPEVEEIAEASADCDCICHKTNVLSRFVYNIIKAIRNLFGMSACDCCA